VVPLRRAGTDVVPTISSVRTEFDCRGASGRQRINVRNHLTGFCGRSGICTQVSVIRLLHKTGAPTRGVHGRIEAARAARRFPKILDLLADGELTLTAVGLLAPHLTPDNHLQLLARARYRSKREIEHLVAEIHPRPDVPSSIRTLPDSRPAAAPLPGDDAAGRADGPSPPTSQTEIEAVRQTSLRLSTVPPVVAPLAPERYRVQFTVSRETFEKLRRVQDLLRHTIPNGDPAAIFDRALTLLLEELDRTRLAATTRPHASAPTKPGSRHIPAAVRRAVWSRDKGRCAFVGRTGRCRETGFLEFHHVTPYAQGGPAVVDNIELRCEAHNAFEAELLFGPRQTKLLRETGPPYLTA
jgi:hypothetical protein